MRRLARIERIGSSPHKRGTLSLSLLITINRRFIPAQAGNTKAARQRRRQSSVHPRTSGEHKMANITVTLEDGSSPHKRGTPAASQSVLAKHRFIPAQAGNTGQPRRLQNQRTVHPRTSGEHNAAAVKRWGEDGSSPHKRGTPADELAIARADRFIPAQAGNTNRR